MSPKSIKVSEEELKKALIVEEKEKKEDPKRKWVQRMVRSARHYHKICPYFDKKKGTCFIKLGGKCERDGKFEACPVFIEFLENAYDKITKSGRPLPMDFQDLALMVV